MIELPSKMRWLSIQVPSQGLLTRSLRHQGQLKRPQREPVKLVLGGLQLEDCILSHGGGSFELLIALIADWLWDPCQKASEQPLPQSTGAAELQSLPDPVITASHAGSNPSPSPSPVNLLWAEVLEITQPESKEEPRQPLQSLYDKPRLREPVFAVAHLPRAFPCFDQLSGGVSKSPETSLLSPFFILVRCDKCVSHKIRGLGETLRVGHSKIFPIQTLTFEVQEIISNSRKQICLGTCLQVVDGFN